MKQPKYYYQFKDGKRSAMVKGLEAPKVAADVIQIEHTEPLDHRVKEIRVKGDEYELITCKLVPTGRTRTAENAEGESIEVEITEYVEDTSKPRIAVGNDKKVK